MNSTNPSAKAIKEESSLESNLMLQNQKLTKGSTASSVKSQKDIKVEEKEFKSNKNEGQKPTMETQGKFKIIEFTIQFFNHLFL